MLVPFLPEQVVEHWEVFGSAIAKTLPPGVNITPFVMTNILRAILAEEAIVWCWQDDAESDYSVMVVTTEVMDKLAGVSNLMVYALASFSPVNRRIWEEGIETLKKLAKAKGYANIIGYSSYPQLVSMLGERGWDTDFTFLKLKV